MSIHDYGRPSVGFHMMLAYEAERVYRASLRTRGSGDVRTMEQMTKVDGHYQDAIAATKRGDAAKRIYGDE